MQSKTLSLPIHAKAAEIIEKVNSHSVIFVQGETGSGKTTQVPQFLYQALKKEEEEMKSDLRPGMIGIT